MPKLVTNGAMMQCSMGLAPSTLTILPMNMTDGDSQPAATVMDYVPMMNIAPFGMCQSMANPQVAAATAAAMGTLTPMPCIPMTTAPWSPGSTIVTIQQLAALLETDTCMCTWAGVITITSAGSVTIDVAG